MTRPARPAIAAAVAGLMLLAAGCGTASPRDSAAPVVGSPAVSLATAITTAGGSWAVAVAGGSAASHNNFWQLLGRPQNSSTWRLVTPPGVASNGGLVIAPAGDQALTAAFRPSQDLAFTPLAATTSLGRHWSAGVLDADLASTPAALAADPATGHMLALLADGTVDQSRNGGATWATLTTYRAISRTGPGRTCRLQNLTAVAFTPAGLPLLGGTCGRPGSVPIFAFTGQTWQAAGPATPPSAAHQPITVLTMTTVAADRTVALLRAGTGPGRALTAAWSAGGGNTASGWALSPSQPLRGRNVLSVSAGSGGAVAVVMSGRAGLVETRPGGAWQPLPQLPARTQVLAIGPGTAIQAIAPAGSDITIWALTRSGGPWTPLQHMTIPIQYGSSS
jgi:hypothetical protein